MKARTGYEERIFDQDDFTGLLIAIGLLLLLGWMWLQGRGSLVEEEATLQPQVAANEPEAPAADPFGPGPVDLRPTSPVPDPPADIAIDPADVETEVTPSAVPVAPASGRASDVGKNPETQLTRANAPPPNLQRTAHAYFCTASSSLTPAGRNQFDRQVAAWKASGSELEFVVTGFADTRGTTTFNAQLGELRADFVAGLLRAEGFTVTEAVGVGELDDIEDEANCPNQRRVDIALKGTALSTPTRACAPPQDVQPLACS